jgi:iron complex transport system substrate-binding protein
MRNPRIWDREKIKKPYDKLKMPNFFFTHAETESIVTFLLSRKDKNVRSAVEVVYADTPTGMIARGRHLAHELNCVACHTIEGNHAKIEKIRELQPDLVLGFSDLQADIAADLVRAGLDVHIFNHRDIAGIFRMIGTLGGMVGCQEKAERLVEQLEQGLERIRATAAALKQRPRVYFEEWDEPLFAGSRWVSEVVGIAGGEECFPELAQHSLGKDRIIADPEEVIRRAPDIILGSWCGKKFRPEQVAARPGWSVIPAVRTGQLHEIKSPIILQPGPAALTDGIAAIAKIIANWRPG